MNCDVIWIAKWKHNLDIHFHQWKLAIFYILIGNKVFLSKLWHKLSSNVKMFKWTIVLTQNNINCARNYQDCRHFKKRYSQFVSSPKAWFQNYCRRRGWKYRLYNCTNVQWWTTIPVCLGRSHFLHQKWPYVFLHFLDYVLKK